MLIRRALASDAATLDDATPLPFDDDDAAAAMPLLP